MSDPMMPEANEGAVVALAVGALLGISGCAVLGAVLESQWAKRQAQGEVVAKDKPASAAPRALPGWAAGVLLVSYGLLLPGILSSLFVADTVFTFFGVSESVSSFDETMVSLIDRLWHDRVHVGAILVAVYAIAIPITKIALLVAGLRLHLRGVGSIHRARICIRIVQSISKWACPDMFAYILLQYLIRNLDKPPELRSDMVLQLGWTCFTVFCVGSTVSSLGVRLPELPAGEVPWGEGLVSRWRSRTSRLAVAVASSVLAVGFLVLLGVGLALPSMSLRLDMELMYISRPELVPLAPFINDLRPDEILKTEVDVASCISALAGWVGEGEVNCFIALVLYVVLAISLPILHVLLLLVSVTGLRPRAAPCGARWLPTLEALTQRVGKLTMLDVSVFGCIVVVASLTSMREGGIIVELRAGTWLLLGAEVCRYAMVAVAQLAPVPQAATDQPEEPNLEAAEAAK